MNKLKIKGFTLVELIIVITILVILATISFISYESYTKNTRDAVRATNLKDIYKSIDIYIVKTGKVPDLDNQYATGSISGDILNYVGYIGENVSRQLSIPKVPKDPLTGNNYVYGIDVTKRKFQVAGVKEDGVVSKIEGNYNGLLKISTGGVLKLYNIPSLIFIGSGNLLSTESYFIAEGSKNIAYSINNDVLNNSQEPNTILQFLTQNTQASITGVIVPRDINSYSGSYYEGILGYSSDFIGISLYGNEYALNNNYSSSNGGSVVVNGLCGSDNGGGFTIEPTNLCSTGIASTVTNNGGGSTYTWICNGNNGGTTDSCSANNTNQTQYPGCNEQDITIGSYTIAACNIGSTIASTDFMVSRGSFFQWGRNKSFEYNDNSQQSTVIDGSIGLNSSTDTYGFVWNSSLPYPFSWSNTDITNNWGHTTNTKISRQGPCAVGYHIPSQEEWLGIITEGGWGSNGANMRSDLKLPYAGFRDGQSSGISTEGSYGYYWSSSSIGGDFGYNLYFRSDAIVTQDSIRARGYSVRCFKN